MVVVTGQQSAGPDQVRTPARVPDRRRARHEFYFCDAASPWQRGSNENTSGLLRQYF